MKTLIMFLIFVVGMIAMAFIGPNSKFIHDGDTYELVNTEYQLDTLVGNDEFFTGAGIYNNIFLKEDVTKNEAAVISCQIKRYKLIKCIHPLHKHK